jgi:hypothetical protein
MKDDEINPTEHFTLTGFAHHDVSTQHSNARIQGSDLGFNLPGPGSKQHQIKTRQRLPLKGIVRIEGHWTSPHVVLVRRTEKEKF